MRKKSSQQGDTFSPNHNSYKGIKDNLDVNGGWKTQGQDNFLPPQSEEIFPGSSNPEIFAQFSMERNRAEFEYTVKETEKIYQSLPGGFKELNEHQIRELEQANRDYIALDKLGIEDKKSGPLYSTPSEMNEGLKMFQKKAARARKILTELSMKDGFITEIAIRIPLDTNEAKIRFGLQDTIENCGNFERWAQNALNSTYITSFPGRRTRSPENYLINLLADLYHQFFDKPPGIPSNGGGPFFRFVEASSPLLREDLPQHEHDFEDPLFVYVKNCIESRQSRIGKVFPVNSIQTLKFVKI